MKRNATKIIATLLASLVMIGCSKQSSTTGSAKQAASPFDATPLLNAPGLADEKLTKEIDETAEKELQSNDTMDATNWLQQHPESQVGKDDQDRPMLLAPVVARFREAGAQKIAVQITHDPQARHVDSLLSLIIVLPADPVARKKIFPLDAGMSAHCDQAPVIDRGQKYLDYSFYGMDDAF